MKRIFYIDYPQEHFEGQAHRYRCAYCKQETTKINGLLAGHLATCQYRVALENAGFEPFSSKLNPNLDTSDEED
jgi:hypothetical protein